MTRGALVAAWSIAFLAISGVASLMAQATPPQPPAGAFHPPSAGAPAATSSPGAIASPNPQAAEPAPVLPLESWRFNARERTARGLAAWNSQNPAEAAAAMDTAARLRPDDPLAAYNAGTAHLGAGLADAAPILERALESAPPELAADVQFNLGNARFAAQDAQGAIDSFKETLRRAPGHAGARRNLELAQQLLDQQKQQQQQQQQKQQQDQNQNQDGEGQQQQPSPGAEGEENPDQPPGEQPPSEGSQPDSNPQPDGSQGQQQPPQGAGSQRESPLPQFKDQKDMSAEQAASILQAVDNLEREKRREEAKRRALVKSGVEKDW